MKIRRLIKSLTPAVLREYRQRWLVRRTRKRSRRRSVAEVFADVYRRQQWTRESGQRFSSGWGSGTAYSQPYCDWVTSFAREHGITRLVDLGCGDFRVGQSLLAGGPFSYVGVDVVPELIAYNQARFAGPQARFECLNIIEDDLPSGQLCLIRQVFQHLSNQQIRAVLDKCAVYPRILVTEHIYVGPDSRPNVDKPHGPDTRVSDRSGVFLDRSPFDLGARTVLEVPYSNREILRSVLLEKQG
jgi:SAM-dependent methyltransferase